MCTVMALCSVIAGAKVLGPFETVNRPEEGEAIFSGSLMKGNAKDRGPPTGRVDALPFPLPSRSGAIIVIVYFWGN